MLDHVDEVWIHAALTSNTRCAYDKKHATNQILSVFDANTKAVRGAIWMRLNDIYVPHDACYTTSMRLILPHLYREILKKFRAVFNIFINILC